MPKIKKSVSKAKDVNYLSQNWLRLPTMIDLDLYLPIFTQDERYWSLSGFIT